MEIQFNIFIVLNVCMANITIVIKLNILFFIFLLLLLLLLLFNLHVCMS